MRYVEGNPVRAGLTKSALDWPWSSHQERLGLKPKRLITEPPIEIMENWTEYVDEPLTLRELDQINRSVKHQTPFGKHEWREVFFNRLNKPPPDKS